MTSTFEDPFLAGSVSDPILRPAGLLRRLAAIFYDSLLLAALLMVVGALWLPVTGGEPIGPHHPYRPLYQLSLLLVAFAFFVGFWLAGGQTLGMRAWRIYVRDAGGGPIKPRQAALRFAGAILSWLPLGLGFLWSLGRRDKKTWHDLLSDTALLYEPKPKRSAKP